MTDSLGLSIVVPVHNEVGSLETLHAELDAALAGYPARLEMIFVDDGSDDGSAEVLRTLAERDARVRVRTLSRRHGQSAALAVGFRAARGDVTATLDADLQNDPADLPRLLERMDDADVVCGVREHRHDHWTRIAAARIANGFRNRMTGESVTDVGCALRVMRTSHLKNVKMFRGMHRFLPTLLALEGASVLEVPVSHRPRSSGRSKYGISDRLFVGLVDVFAVRWMQRRAFEAGLLEPSAGEQAAPRPPQGAGRPGGAARS